MDYVDQFLDSHKKQIVDHIEDKDFLKKIKITEWNIFDALANELVRDMPFGQSVDKVHVVLTQAIICSLWCGWLSQAMANKNEPKFSPEYVQQFKKAIMDAFEMGQSYASKRP